MTRSYKGFVFKFVPSEVKRSGPRLPPLAPITLDLVKAP